MGGGGRGGGGGGLANNRTRSQGGQAEEGGEEEGVLLHGDLVFGCPSINLGEKERMLRHVKYAIFFINIDIRIT